MDVQVGIHELLGHGSGKLFHKDTPDAEALVAKALPHPISGEPITGPFYDAGTTWDSTFGKIASTCVHQRSISSSLVCRAVSSCLRLRPTTTKHRCRRFWCYRQGEGQQI